MISFNDFTLLDSIEKEGQIITPYNDTSFLWINNHTLYKYNINTTDDTLEIDPRFNPSNNGSLAFTQGLDLFPESTEDDAPYIPFTSIKLFNNYLLIGGEYKISDDNYYPYLVCYNIENLSSPYLEPTFFKTGYYIPDFNNYPGSQWGATSLLVTQTNIPCLFFASDKYLTYLPLPDTFTRKCILAKDIQQHLSYLRAQSTARNISPFAFIL